MKCEKEMGLGRSGGRHSGKGQQCQCPGSRTGSAFKKLEKVAETWSEKENGRGSVL